MRIKTPFSGSYRNLRRSFISFLLLSLSSVLTISSSATAQSAKTKALNQILQTPDSVIENTIKNYRDKISVLQLFKGIYVELYPKVEPIYPVITVRLHPSFITTIQLPPGVKILKAVASFKPKHFVFRDNMLEVQPTKDFVEGNAVVYYRDGTVVKQIQFFFKSVNPYSNVSVEKIFYPQVVLTKDRVLSPIEVLESYKLRYGHYPEENTYYRLKGISYRIEINKLGNVRVNGRTYLVVPCKRT